MLLGNFNVFNKNPGHAIGGPSDPTLWYKAGSVQNWFVGEASVSGQTEKDSFPSGYNPPYSYILAPEAGGISSRYNGNVAFSSTANLVGGRPGQGTSTITFSSNATGGLIVSGVGSASITFSSTATLASVAVISGSGSITISGSALLGAQAGLTASTSITLTGTATSYAIGYLSGLSTSETEFSAAALADAVWNALTADYQLSGSFGEAMAAAGSAGDPWTTNLPGTYVAGQAGYIVGNQVLTEDDLTKIADIILRRATSNVEASSNGDTLSVRSLYGMIAQGTHNTSIAGTTLTITKSDDSTALGTRTITTDASAEPITGLDTD